MGILYAVTGGATLGAAAGVCTKCLQDSTAAGGDAFRGNTMKACACGGLVGGGIAGPVCAAIAYSEAGMKCNREEY